MEAVTEIQKPKRSVVLEPQRMKLAEFATRTWNVFAEHGHTIEDILDSGYWSHKAFELHPCDEITVWAEDMVWMAKLVVITCGRNWAKVFKLSDYYFDASEIAKSIEAKHEVSWKGPQHRFCIIRKADGEMIKTGYVDKAEANRGLIEYEKTVG